MIRTLIQNKAIHQEEKNLKNNLKTIKLKFKVALHKVSATDIVESLNNVFLELRTFERNNCTNIGYTNKIKSAVFVLYHKIDLVKVKFLPEINRIGSNNHYID